VTNVFEAKKNPIPIRTRSRANTRRSLAELHRLAALGAFAPLESAAHWMESWAAGGKGQKTLKDAFNTP